MSKFYGQVFGMSSTSASRRGGSDIKVSAQSYDGSVITKLYYNDAGKLMVEIETDKDSDSSGDTKFKGTFEEFNKLFDKKEINKEICEKLIDYNNLSLDSEIINIIAEGATEQEFDIIDWNEFINELASEPNVAQTLYEYDMINQEKRDELIKLYSYCSRDGKLHFSYGGK